MADQPLIAHAVRLGVSLDALAALAAHARVTTEGLDIDPAVRALLDAIAAEVAGVAATDAPDPTAPSVVGMARAFLRQAIDLVESPGRVGAWGELDVALLQGMGRLSMAIADAVGVAEADLPGLGEALRSPGAAVLDVGTGTAWLAVALARRYPAARVVGLDIFEPALALARANVTAEGMDDRIEIRTQDVAELSEVDAYDAIWLPLPFLPKAVVPAAVAAAARALRPGGWLLPGLFAGPEGRLSELLTDLRAVRSGGYPWPADELLELLAAHGFTDGREVPRRWPAPVRLFAARRP